MRGFTLIIDGHNFFFRSLWGAFRRGSSKLLSNKKDIDEYERKLLIDFCQTAKQFSSIANDIVFVVDSYSWRKDLLLSKEYKGNRKKNRENIDKDGFNTATANFTKTLTNYGVKVSLSNRCEGDDLIYTWSNSLFNDGVSSIIFSTDKDLTQLVKCVNDVHIIQYSPLGNHLFVSNESYEFINSLSNRRLTEENLFDELLSIPIDNDPLEKFTDGCVLESVDPEKIRFLKIVGGDTSDNISPVYYRPGNGTTKSKGLGEKTVDKIYANFCEKLGCNFDYHIYSNDEVIKILCDVIYETAKINDDEFTKRMLFENIKTNAKLVSLTEESIPSDIMDGMCEDVNMLKKIKPIIVSKITRESIFSKSRFGDYSSSIKVTSSALRGIKDDEDMSFIKM